MSIFTRQHHQAIAEVIAETRRELLNVYVNRTPEDVRGAERLIADLCKMFLRDNPNFNREKFLKACGMERE